MTGVHGGVMRFQTVEMLEFRAVCDPNYKGTLYVDTVTAEARPGQAVSGDPWPVCRT